jgi:hypothetical protein
MTVTAGLDLRAENFARRPRDPEPGASAAVVTDQAQPAPEWVVNMGAPLAHQAAVTLLLCCLSVPTRMHRAEPLVTGGAGTATSTRPVTT